MHGSLQYDVRKDIAEEAGRLAKSPHMKNNQEQCKIDGIQIYKYLKMMDVEKNRGGRRSDLTNHYD